MRIRSPVRLMPDIGRFLPTGCSDLVVVVSRIHAND